MDYVDIRSVDNTDNLHSVIREELKKKWNIKVPKAKKVSKKLNTSKSQDIPSEKKIFGNFLSHVPFDLVENCGPVPTFLIDASKVIEENITLEGLFRKSGSLSRQKELKQQIDDGQNLDGANVFDVTSLIKQFFRELPEPLFTGVYHDSFIKCYHCIQDNEVTEGILLLCLLLPCEHLSTLRFTMHLLAKIAEHSHINKMDRNNLAVVVAPNIMHQNKKSELMNASEEKLLQFQTAVVEILLENFKRIGMVENKLYQDSQALNEYQEYFGTDDELDNSEDTLECSKDVSQSKKSKKKRKRSGSLQGIVSSIAQGISKLRKSVDGKTVNVSHGSYISNESTVSHTSIKATPQELMPGATPILMRKRKASSEMVAFSANKKMAILQNLPLQTALANTPFTPMSAIKKDDARKLAPLETPNIDFSDKNDVAFSATPHQDPKNVRKRLNLFSPGNLRKSKRGPSVSNPALQCTKKPSKTKNILRRLSGSRADKLDMPQAASSAHVGQRLAGSTGDLESTDDEHNLDSTDATTYTESPIAVILHNSVLSASNIDHSTMSVNECRNSLNEAFIDPTDLDFDVSPPHSPSTSSAIYPNGKEFIKSPLTESVSDTAIIKMNQSCMSEKLHNRSKSADGRSLKRGQPNTIATGLLQGEQKKVHKLRRSYGSDKPQISDPIPLIVPDTENYRDVKYLEPDPTVNTEGSEGRLETPKICVTPHSPDNTSHKYALVGNMSSQSSSKSLDSSNSCRGSANRDPQKAFSDTQLQYQRKTLQHSNSTDSVISSISSSSIESNQLQRCDSIDSGKGSLGSLLDGHCSNEKQTSDRIVDIPCDTNSIDNVCVVDSLQPHLSSPNKLQTNSANISIIRSQNVYDNLNSKNKGKPNLQICQETQNLLSRAGFLQVHKTGDVEVVQLPRDITSNERDILSDSPSLMEVTEDMIVDNGSPGNDENYTGTDVQRESFKTPSVPSLIHADLQLPKHESIVELKSNNAGKVAECVRAFRKQSDNSAIPADVMERHASPYRFPNSVSRKRGVSPIRIPTIFAKDDTAATAYREKVQVRDKLQNRLGARLPISTQLIKPSENATADNNVIKCDGVTSNFKRKPSIYYVTDAPKYSHKGVKRSGAGGSSLSSASDHSESMDLSSTDNSMGDISQTDGVSDCLNTSTFNSINELCTPLSKKVVCQDTRTPLKDCNEVITVNEKLLQKSSIELTPRQVIQYSKPSRTSCKSPAKSIKRLQSPGSPCRSRSGRYSTSPHKIVQGKTLSSVPPHLHDYNNDV